MPVTRLIRAALVAAAALLLCAPSFSRAADGRPAERSTEATVSQVNAGIVRKDLARTPYTIKVLLETVLRNCGRGFVTEEDVKALAAWTPGRLGDFGKNRLQDLPSFSNAIDVALRLQRDHIANFSSSKSNLIFPWSSGTSKSPGIA